MRAWMQKKLRKWLGLEEDKESLSNYIRISGADINELYRDIDEIRSEVHTLTHQSCESERRLKAVEAIVGLADRPDGMREPAPLAKLNFALGELKKLERATEQNADSIAVLKNALPSPNGHPKKPAPKHPRRKAKR